MSGKHLKKIRDSKKEKAEKERRRQAAFKEKERKIMGAKPTGVKKNKKPAPKMEFSGFRLVKRNEE